MTWLTATECLCQKLLRICSSCRYHNPVLSLFMTCHLVCNTMGVTCGAGTAYPLGAHGFTNCFSGVVLLDSHLVFWAVFYRSLFVLLSFFFSANVLFVLWFTALYFPIGIFILFLWNNLFHIDFILKSLFFNVACLREIANTDISYRNAVVTLFSHNYSRQNSKHMSMILNHETK